jgi:hypothetical protein
VRARGLTSAPCCTGDLDPALVSYMVDHGLTPAQVHDIMNFRSGFLGMAGEHLVEASLQLPCCIAHAFPQIAGQRGCPAGSLPSCCQPLRHGRAWACYAEVPPLCVSKSFAVHLSWGLDSGPNRETFLRLRVGRANVAQLNLHSAVQ